ncbi:MAG: glycosyltransferase family 4 protein [Patescibacteria group bacterium]|jgi:glycosyltransferase involved in cell wall biosynthesis
MKIAQLVCVYPPYKGGIGTSAQNFARIFKSAGNEVKTFTMNSPLERGGRTQRVAFGVLRDGVCEVGVNDVAYLKAFPSSGKGGFLPQLFWRLKDFDLIYLHYPFFGASEIVWFLKKFIWRKNKKLVIHYHMDVVLPNLFLKILSLPSALIFNSLFKNVDLIVSASLDYVKNSHLKNIYAKYLEKFVEIPFGVDIEKFKPAEAKKENNKFNILFVGGLDKAHYFKGINILLEAVAKLSPLLFREGMGVVKNWQLNIVGSGDLEESYKVKAQDLNIANKVKFLGNVSDEDLPKKYQEADCFVLPSTNKGEAFGIVLIEAMASGLPVIASDLSGVRGVFSSESGLLIKSGDAEELKEKIEILMNNPAKCKEMGEVARREAEEKYSFDIVSKKVIEVLN